MALDDLVSRSDVQRQHSGGQLTRLLYQLHPPNDHRRWILALKANEQLLRQVRRYRVRQKFVQPHHSSNPIRQCFHKRSAKQTS